MIDECKIKKLHASNLYGRFVENGGPCLAAELLKVEGASKTICSAYIPYFKNFGYLAGTRAVSFNNVKAWLTSLANDDLEEINFDFVSSFQICERSTHGYVGLCKNDKTKIYHLTLNGKWERKKAIDILNENCF
jgi:hypothetical protein